MDMVYLSLRHVRQLVRLDGFILRRHRQVVQVQRQWHLDPLKPAIYVGGTHFYGYCDVSGPFSKVVGAPPALNGLPVGYTPAVEHWVHTEVRLELGNAGWPLQISNLEAGCGGARASELECRRSTGAMQHNRVQC